jgi:hypothetical protein
MLSNSSTSRQPRAEALQNQIPARAYGLYQGGGGEGYNPHESLLPATSRSQLPAPRSQLLPPLDIPPATGECTRNPQ